jgi:hypothetical protein
MMSDGINAEDVVAVLGLDPIRGPVAVYGSQIDGKPRASNLYSLSLEDYAIDTYESATGKSMVKIFPYKSQWRTSDALWITLRKNAPMPKLGAAEMAYFTGIEACPWAERILQIETPRTRDLHQWGEATGHVISPRQVHSVPYRAVVKAVWNMHVTKIWRGDIVAVLEDEVRIYPIEYDQKFAQAIDDGVTHFYQEYVEKKVMPTPDYRPSCYEFLSTHFAEPKDGYLLDPNEESIAIAQHLRATNALLKQHRLQAEELVNKLCAMMGEAEGIEGVCTWKKDIGGVRRFRLLGDEN